MINTPVLRQLIRVGKAGTLVAKGIPGGFLLLSREGVDEQFVEAQRGHARKFKRLDSVASYLMGLGAHEFRVETEQWRHKTLDTKS